MDSSEGYARQIRKVFKQTWRDFHRWRPQNHRQLDPTRVPLNSETEAVPTGLDQWLAYVDHKHRSLPSDRRNTTNSFESFESVTGPRTITTRPLSSKTGASRHLYESEYGHFACKSPEPTSLPRYTFCLPLNAIRIASEEKTASFIPLLGENEEEAFRDIDYANRFFQPTAMVKGSRDANVDIILVETHARLREKQISDECINSSRMLPMQVVGISSLDLERDLPLFPVSPPHILAQPVDDAGKRDWGEAIVVEADEEDIERGRMDLDELWCGNAVCETYGCAIHIGNAREYIFPPHPLPSTAEKNLIRTSRPAKPCSKRCQSMEDFEQEDAKPWSDVERAKLLKLLLHMSSTENNYSCFHRRCFSGRSCAEVHHQIKIVLQSDAPAIKIPISHPLSQLPRAPAISNLQRATQLDSITRAGSSSMPRPIFETRLENMRRSENCYHPGLACTPGPGGCICANNKLHCERTCFCAPDCDRRFAGCTCRVAKSSTGLGTAVCHPSKCECAKAGRECDPDVCISCGSRDALLTASRQSGPRASARMNSKGPVLSCCNVVLQAGSQANLRVGVSKVSGFGLFAAQDIDKNSFIIEYIGEQITQQEGLKRDYIYASTRRNYLFDLNKESLIDGGNIGNIARFINSGNPSQVNCVPKVLSVLGDHRIAFSATRKIKRHEELFFDYGEHFLGVERIGGRKGGKRRR